MNKKELSMKMRELARKGKGVPRVYTQEEIYKRTKRLAEARLKRWPKKKGVTK